MARKKKRKPYAARISTERRSGLVYKKRDPETDPLILTDEQRKKRAEAGRLGGLARGDKKVRGDSAYYAELAAKRKNKRGGLRPASNQDDCLDTREKHTTSEPVPQRQDGDRDS
jgi:hypothetical protein